MSDGVYVENTTLQEEQTQATDMTNVDHGEEPHDPVLYDPVKEKLDSLLYEEFQNMPRRKRGRPRKQRPEKGPPRKRGRPSRTSQQKDKPPPLIIVKAKDEPLGYVRSRVFQLAESIHWE